MFWIIEFSDFLRKVSYKFDCNFELTNCGWCYWAGEDEHNGLMGIDPRDNDWVFMLTDRNIKKCALNVKWDTYFQLDLREFSWIFKNFEKNQLRNVKIHNKRFDIV